MTRNKQPGFQAAAIGATRRGIRAARELDDVVYYAQKDSINYPDGLRADASFLTKGGELIRRSAFDFQADDSAIVASMKQASSQLRKSGKRARKHLGRRDEIIDLTLTDDS